MKTFYNNTYAGSEHRSETTQKAKHIAEDLLVDDGGDGQAVEAVGEGLPQLDVVAALALVVEPIYPVNTGALVIATQNKEVLGVLDFISQKKTNRFQGLLSAINIVT